MNSNHARPAPRIHPLSKSSRILRGILAGTAILVCISVLVIAQLVDSSSPATAENLRGLVSVLFSLALFTIVNANWLQLVAILVFTSVSVFVVSGPLRIDPTTVAVVNLALSAIVTFVGSGVRTIFK